MGFRGLRVKVKVTVCLMINLGMFAVDSLKSKPKLLPSAIKSSSRESSRGRSCDIYRPFIYLVIYFTERHSGSLWLFHWQTQTLLTARTQRSQCRGIEREEMMNPHNRNEMKKSSTHWQRKTEYFPVKYVFS